MDQGEQADDLWLRRFHEGVDGDPLLVCFPHAGGSAAYFFPVSAALSGSANVLAVQYPGRQDRRREPPVDTIDELAAAVFTALRGVLDRPLVFFGHSMGAVTCYEVARAMERETAGSPLGIIVSGRRAPSLHRTESVHTRDDQGLITEVRSLEGTDAGVLGDEELLRMILPALRTDYKAIETYRYRPGPPLRCPIAAYVGDSDPKVAVSEAAAWRDHTSASFALRVFAGGHFYLGARPAETIKAVSEDILAFRAAIA